MTKTSTQLSWDILFPDEHEDYANGAELQDGGPHSFFDQENLELDTQ